MSASPDGPIGIPRAASGGPGTTVELSAGSASAVRLLFVEETDHVYVIPTESPSGWYTAAIRERSCRLRWPDGREATCSTSMLVDPVALQRLRVLFSSKYGDAVWADYFEGRREALRIDLGRAPTPPTELERTRGEFDALASGYAAGVARTPFERYLKDRTCELALAEFSDRDPVLEIGPGAGYHTLPLLAAGHTVVAVDVSERMLEQLRAAAEGAGTSGRLVTKAARLSALSSALADLPDGHFGAAFSAFGAFNLEPELGPAVHELRRVIRPGGRLAFTSLNRPGVAPLLWDLLTGRPSAAGHRLNERVPPGRVRYPLELHLRSPGDWDRTLSDGFARNSARAVAVLTPPFESARIVRFLGARGAGRAQRWDAYLASRTFGWIAAEWLFLTYDRVDGRG